MERKHGFKSLREKFSRLKFKHSETEAEPEGAHKHSAGSRPRAPHDNNDDSNVTNHGSMFFGVGESLQILANTHIKDLWNVAYENLREDDKALVTEYETLLEKSVAAICGPTLQALDWKINVRDQIGVILQRKIEEAEKKSTKLKLKNSEISTRDVINTVARFVSSASEYITAAVNGNPQASIAWAGASILLPLLMNPSIQSNSLAKGLERVSDLINLSRMREEHYESRTENDEKLAQSHLQYKRALEELYRQILKFQAVSCCYYSKQSAVRLGLDVIKQNDWDQLVNEVNNRENAFLEMKRIWGEIQYEKDRKEVRNDQRMAMSGIDSQLNASRKAFEATAFQKKFMELLDWLCNVDASSIYNTARNKHEEGTCEWLVNDSEDFRTWDTSPTSLMWLHGKAGSGKSILSSAVIKYLKIKCDSQPSQVLAYFYFSFSDSEKQKVDLMLASLIRQIWSCLSDTPQFFEQFSQYKLKGEYPDIQTLETALLAAGADFSSVHLVIDGLDECPVYDGERAKLLKSLCRVLAGAPENFHILLTSRKEWDIDLKLRHLFSSPSRIEINLSAKRDLINQDISHYIDSTLETEDYELWPASLKERARQSLLDKADCMFQYVRCQFDALQKLSSMLEIEKALDNLPTGLDATYDRILEAIDPSVKTQVVNLLKWLAFSRKVLRLVELSEAFIIRPDSDSPFDEKQRLLSPQHLKKYLPGLIVTEAFSLSRPIRILENGDEIEDPPSNEPIEYDPSENDLSKHQSSGVGPLASNIEIRVRLVHFSIKEYLISDRIGHSNIGSAFALSEADAHLSIARSCLKYQIHLNTKQFTRENVRKLYPLAKYALGEWMFHLEELPMQLWPLEVIQNAKLALASYSQQLYRQIYFEHDSTFKTNLVLKPYCYTAFWGHFQLTEMLMSREQHGAMKYAIQEDLNEALLCAAQSGNMGMVQFLIESGAKIDAEDENWIRIFKITAEYRPLSLLKFLIQHISDPKGFQSNDTKWLIESMRSSRSDSLEFLLNDGANINMQDEEGTILHSATMKFDLEKVRLLLAKGANVNAINETYGTPLQALFGGFIVTLGNTWSHRTSQLEEYITSFKDSELSMIFNLLIENGADVDLHGGYYNMALNAICTKIGLFSNSDIVSEKIQLLINQGADVNASVSHYGTAIHVACDSYARLYRSSDESPYDFDQLKKCLQLLIQHGADLNSQEKGYRTPLQMICGRSHDADVIDHVRSLIEMGADVNIQSDEYGTALHAAGGEGWWAGKSTDRVLELLLKNGAEVDLRGNKHPGTPLQSACKWGNKNVMQLLLKYGANVNAPGGRYGTALIAACSFYNYPGWQNSPFGFQMEIVRSLLEHGADVNAVAALYDEDESTALIAACNTKNLVVVQLLLQNGADVNLCDGFALHAAVIPEYLCDTQDLLQLLLNHGCDINHVHEEHGTALSYVVTPMQRRYDRAAGHNEQIIRFLLDEGADVNLMGGALGFALQAACTGHLALFPNDIDINEHSNNAKFLLENCPDINVNAEGGPFGSALQAASYSGQTQSVRMLLERKANVNAHGGKYGSALNAAIVRGHWNIVEILLEAGAIPDCHLQQCPDEDWLQRIKESEDEDQYRRGLTGLELRSVSQGSLAVKRYRKFWEVETREREEKVRREDLQMD